MTNDSSLGGAVTHSAFDFESQKGITILLASLRESDLTKQQKNEIRDLVFEYTSGGRDETTKLTLEQKIKSFNLQSIKPAEKNSAADKEASPAKPFGMSRPSPSFSPAAVQSGLGHSAQSPIPTPTEVSKPQPQPEPEPELVKDEPVVSPQSAPEPELTNVAPQSAPAPVPEAVVEKPVEPQTPKSVTPIDSDQSLQRIKEIKSLVNEKVGNPVNLVDINNEVGREYMGAMLDAMKKLNTGSAAVSAMQRLEAAYSQVEKTLKENPPTASENKIAPEPSVKKPESQPVPVTPKPEPVKQAAPEPNPVNSQASAPNPAPKPIVPKEPSATITEHETPKPVAPPVPVTEPEPKLTPAPTPVPRESAEERWGPASDTLEKVNKSTVESNQKSVSVGESSQKLKTPDDLPESSSLETSSVAGDPLFTKEVDEGLNQLLVEWPIFKKSGLFGTGPKGRQHPLFLKLSGLQIPLLLAGRFEGATQEIKQSITDYMNGWRYEQGIIYKQGENFEHYLRRVIRHIIDLQNK